MAEVTMVELPSDDATASAALLASVEPGGSELAVWVPTGE